MNGLQFGLMLFPLAAGLTLVFSIKGMINLAHGSLCMVGAYLTTRLAEMMRSFLLVAPLVILATALIGMLPVRVDFRHVVRGFATPFGLG